MVGGGKDREEMRLIDAEKCPCIVCEDTRNAHCTYEHRSCEKFCNWLNNTAFDTEKVIKQLLDMRLIRVEQCCEDYEIEVMTESNFDDAIDIVKKGGVE